MSSAEFSGQLKSPQLKKRYRRILWFASALLAQSWWFEIALPSLGLSKISSRSRVRRLTKAARKFRKLATELTGLMIKLGQFFSSRLDVLPEAITRELEGMQDEVEAAPWESIARHLENELGMGLDDAFAEIDAVPMAAASLGQVHAAQLSQSVVNLGFDSQVVVKVLRPGIEEVIAVDLMALNKVSRWLSRVKLVSRRVDAPALLAEFAQTTFEEIDYFNEAKNLEVFRENFRQDIYVGVPNVVWERTSKRVLTLTNVKAIKISDIQSIRKAGINPDAVAAELARVTFQQIFVHGFFHADPHPGNIFVTPTNLTPGGFRLTFIDFGMMGSVGANQREELRRFIFAVAARDSRAWVEAVQNLGVLLPSADTVRLEMAIDALFKRFGGVAINDIVNTDIREFRDLALQFSDLVRTLPFQVPENFLLLVRSISLVSGVTSALNQKFNMWDALDPFARALLQGGSNGFLASVGNSALEAFLSLTRLPSRLETSLLRLERGETTIRNPQLEQRIRNLERIRSSQTYLLLTAALVTGGLCLQLNGNLLGVWLLACSTITGALVIFVRKLP